MKTLLIIDDEVKITNLYRRLLEDEGYEVLIAHNANEGTQLMIRNDNIDLILLDINMPEVDGSYMKTVVDEYKPNFKVIVSSVRPIDEQKEAIPNAADYFDKSKGTDVLLKKVNRVFQNV